MVEDNNELKKQETVNTEDTKEETVSSEKNQEEIKKENISKTANAKEDKKKKKSREQMQIEALKAEINQMRDERNKEHETFLKARADLENVRRRVQEEAIKDRKYASMSMVSELITPVDMLVKASNMQTEDVQMKNFLIGFQMIATQIVDILKRDGLQEIEAKDKEFDPNFHQAMAKEHVEGVEPGRVIEVMQTGYKYKDRIIKPSMVKVSE